MADAGKQDREANGNETCRGILPQTKSGRLAENRVQNGAGLKPESNEVLLWLTFPVRQTT